MPKYTVKEVQRNLKTVEGVLKNMKVNLLSVTQISDAWGNLQECVLQKKKDKVKGCFIILEQLIEERTNFKPKQLGQKYRNARDLIISASSEGDAAKGTVSPNRAVLPPSLPDIKESRIVSQSNVQSSPQMRNGNAVSSKRSSEKLNYHLDQDVDIHLDNQEEQVDRPMKSLQQKYAKLEETLKDTQKQLKKAISDKEYWINRTSQMAGEKLTQDNADVVDLSDRNRPHKLAEQFSEAYDNEWTDAMEVLSNIGIQQREGIDVLSSILKRCYGMCMNIAENQMKELQNSLMTGSSEKEFDKGCPIEVQRGLKDMRKQTSSNALPFVQEEVKKTLITQQKELPMEKFGAFVHKCTHICWYMVIQSPKACFLWPKGGENGNIDFDRFKPFTKSGEKLDYVVWPAMLLHKDGPLLMKGVVQPHPGSK